MIRSELVARIAEQNPYLYARDAQAVVDAILDRIATALADGDRVELRDFGTFETRDREARTGRNPRTGQSVAVAAKRDVRFRPGKALRARLNLDRVDPEHEVERLSRAS
ncbi:integration host factor subunit beta [Methylobacterium phyllostachyos]|uniref:Integration host factor subunit beta n=1 Tax=Methylobacterium phyllostachyos TaxID=582672 RepID=A0A1H0KI70_9HYPH|nr:HU family DNA-binding protein [Methylobacterium phyllostachyos]SDO55523.1 integration host factor subunit beta [Methylobacterium phyllostachyos]